MPLPLKSLPILFLYGFFSATFCPVHRFPPCGLAICHDAPVKTLKSHPAHLGSGQILWQVTCLTAWADNLGRHPLELWPSSSPLTPLAPVGGGRL